MIVLRKLTPGRHGTTISRCVWSNDESDHELARAREFASIEGYEVLTGADAWDAANDRSISPGVGGVVLTMYHRRQSNGKWESLWRQFFFGTIAEAEAEKKTLVGLGWTTS